MIPFLQYTRNERRFWRRSLRINYALYAFNALAIIFSAAVIGRRYGSGEYEAAMIQIAPMVVSFWALRMCHRSIKRAKAVLRSLISLVRGARRNLRTIRADYLARWQAAYDQAPNDSQTEES